MAGIQTEFPATLRSITIKDGKARLVLDVGDADPVNVHNLILLSDRNVYVNMESAQQSVPGTH